MDDMGVTHRNSVGVVELLNYLLTSPKLSATTLGKEGAFTPHQERQRAPRLEPQLQDPPSDAPTGDALGPSCEQLPSAWL